MGRYTGPKGKLSRREGQDLMLKGAKTFSEKNPLKRKPQAPGQHGTSRRRLSDYGTQLREKQKVKRMYGIYEKQFKNYYLKASKLKGVTGEALLNLLEMRIDNVVYRSGIAATRAQARQWVRQGKFTLNGKPVKTPSIQIQKGDTIEVDKNLAVSIPEEYQEPKWLSFSEKSRQIKVKDQAVRDDITDVIQEQLIVEYYSR
jgi:small subunit ribosomal protein S4